MSNRLLLVIIPLFLGAFLGYILSLNNMVEIAGKYDSQTVAMLSTNLNSEPVFMPWSRALNIADNGEYNYLLITGIGSGASWSGELHVSQEKVSFEHSEFEPFLPEGRNMLFWEKLVLSKSPTLYDSMKPVKLDDNGSFILFSKFTASVFEKM
ncbi:hypothetical protein [Vibrio coralliilyticus]|uniref:hypothetical protein n=1 Tax=Vibrio coralliilyticus TaxID=190893 RepID=UPI00081039C2|nr:hypothetical protein [Vibrio coralliilyticus]ANW27124.1 hypothetical protein BA953_23685 [Vibrio coralliilyticus]